MYCVVPKCYNNNKTPGISMYRFPPDEKIQLIWKNRIRRKNYIVDFNDRICSWHFTEGKEKGPLRFSWNTDKDFKLNGLTNGDKKNKPSRKIKLPEQNNPAPSENEIKSKRRKQDLRKILTQDGQINEPEIFICNNAEINITGQIPLLESTSCEKCLDKNNLENLLQNKEEEIENLGKKLEKLSKIIEIKNIKINEQFNEIESFKKENNKIKNKQEESNKISEIKNMTLNKQSKDIQFLKEENIELKKKLQVKYNIDKFNNQAAKNWKKKTLVAFTGLQDYSSIEILINMLKRKEMSYLNGVKQVTSLTFDSQLILTLIKLKTDLPFNCLAYMFDISDKTVSNIFRSCIEGIHSLFYLGTGPLSKLPSKMKTTQNMPKAFSTMQNCRIVIDCTEFQVVQPSKLEDKKSVFSHYKNKTTVKVLIGCAPNGTVTFVSDLFCGSESDKSIVIKSKLLEKLEPGDLILADKGFQLYDILPSGITLNIPSFLHHNQFTTNEALTNLCISRARGIIERLNARFKVFRILDCIKASNRSLAEKIMKVCVSLTLLMPSLYSELYDEAE